MQESDNEVRRNPLGKTMQVLGWMIEGLPQTGGVREIAQDLRMAPSTVHRILRHLQATGLVEVDPSVGRYRLGAEFFRLARRAVEGYPLSEVALPVMRELVDRCNETALLGLYDPWRMQMMFVASVESEHPLRYVVRLNDWVPVYAGATGLAIMAFLPEKERQDIAARTGLVALTDATIHDFAHLESELEEIRRRGYAFTRGQRIPGAVGLAAPVWGPDGRVIGDLALTVPEQRFKEQDGADLGRMLIRHADRISGQLGARVPSQGEV